MNIVSQMCAIAVMFVIMYFYISQKKIILHTSKAFAEVWIAGLLSLFFDIFALVAIEKRSGYPHTATNIICKLYLWTVTWVAMVAFWYICVDIFRKKELERKWRKRLWIFGILTDILIMVVPIKIYDSDNIVYTYGPGCYYNICSNCNSAGAYSNADKKIQSGYKSEKKKEHAGLGGSYVYIGGYSVYR